MSAKKTTRDLLIRCMKFLFGLIFLILTSLATTLVLLRGYYSQAAHQVCDLVDKHYYQREQPEARQFVEWCRKSAADQSFYLSKASNVRRLNDRLSMLRSSHLAVYNPEENKMIWENHGLDTGIRARIVEDQLVVFRVLRESPAYRLGVRPGDSLISLNGEQISGGWVAQTRGGRFLIRRLLGEEIWLDIQPEEIAEVMAPSVGDLGGGLALLSVPSFLGQYFESQTWRNLSKRLARYKGVVVDLRDNSGGSFPAMLRVLSTLLCNETTIGQINHAAGLGLKAAVNLSDDLEAESQLLQLAAATAVHLRTYSDYGCYRGPLRVLVNAGTSSVAEIFAEALMMRARTHLYGQPTAGQVVMARWFPLVALGNDSFMMSIPIAGYQTVSGTELEEIGVRPTTYLYYDLPRSLEGRDSWLEQVIVSF
jgi:carboxyl-terminal processing protease